MRPYSLRRRLLLWLLVATLVMGLIALFDTWREALRTAQSVSDRVLFGSDHPLNLYPKLDESPGLTRLVAEARAGGADAAEDTLAVVAAVARFVAEDHAAQATEDLADVSRVFAPSPLTI